MKRQLCCLLTGAALLYGEAIAGDPVAVSINGKVVAAPCQVSSDSVAKTVPLTGAQGVRASSLSTPGSATDWVPFDVTIERCPVGTATATMLFAGDADSAGPDDRYRNTGSAGNIAVQLQSAGGAPLGNNKTLSGAIANRGYVYHLRARAYSSQGGVTPGTINSVVTVTFSWQ